MSEQRNASAKRWEGVLLAAGSLLWLAIAQELAARAATGLGAKLLGGTAVSALQGSMTLFLVVLGLQIASRRSAGGSWRQQTGLIQRPTSAREWGLGVAVGWAAVVASVLPLVLMRSLHVSFWQGWRGMAATVFSLAGVAAGTLAIELVYRCFAFAQLSKGLGRFLAAVVLIGLYGVLYGQAGPRGVLVGCALAGLFLTGWVRTHAVWLPWGLHMGWVVSLGLIFGLPVESGADLSGLVLAEVRSALLDFPSTGPSGMGWTAVVVVVSLAVLVWVTRNYAWSYTHPVIVAGGYPMEAAPPPAHAAMEAIAASRPAPLVQIAAAAPPPRADVGPTKQD